MKFIKMLIVFVVFTIQCYALPNETLFFTADDGTHGNELWKYDKSVDPIMVADVNSHSKSSSISSYMQIGDITYLTINKNDGNGTQLWKYEDNTLSSMTTADSVGTSFAPSNLFNINNTLYFTGTTDENGTEIYYFDENNNAQIIETNENTENSSPSNLISYNGKTVFTATSPEYGTELYETNGTNITLLSDIYSGSASSSPNNFIEYDGKLYFVATDSVYGSELRVYDGVNVSLVQDLDIGASDSSISNLIVYENKLYFTASYLNGTELYSFDGMSIKIASDIGKNEYSSSPSYLTLFDDKLYFSAQTYNETGRELYYFDGNTSTLVSDIKDGTGSSSPSYLTVAGDRLFFRATADDGDTELYYTTGGNTVKKVNVYTGTYTNSSGTYTYQNKSNPSNLIAYNGDLYFTAKGTKGTEFYMYDNSAEKSKLVKDFYTGTYTSGSNSYQNNGNPSNYVVANGNLYIEVTSSSSNTYLYEYTSSGTLTQLSGSYKNPSNQYEGDGKLYFVIEGDESEYDKDETLYSYDGLVFTKIVDFNDFSNLYYSNEKLYITANSLKYGTELFVHDGTDTTLIKDINTYTENISIGSSIIYNDKLVFSGNSDEYGTELWEFNGTKVSLVQDLQEGRSSSNPSNFIEMDNKLYFTCSYPNKGTELCTYDGSNLTLAADVDSGSESSSISELTVNGSTLYFHASTDEYGSELWKYTNGSASLVKDIYSGSYTSGNNTYKNSSSPSSLTNVGNRVYFKATGTKGSELYYTDSSGTYLAVDLYPGTRTSGSNTYQNNGYPSNLTEYDGKLYFTASLDDKGNELYVYNIDGSYSLIQDLNEGTASSSPSYLTVFNDKLLFRAYTINTGNELFEYDGTSITLVNEIDASSDGNGNARSSSPSSFQILGDNLFFTASSLASGSELYIYDGTTVSTIGDLNSKTSSYNFSNFTSYKNQLYFSGNTDNNGTELWTYDLENKPYMASAIKSNSSSSSPYYLTSFLNKLYFRASTDNNGTELVSFDGTNYSIVDIYPGTSSSSPSNITVYKNELLFLGSSSQGYGLHSYNGFSTPNKIIGSFSGFSYPTVCNDLLYFQASGTDGSGSELWIYDGNSTKMAVDIHETGSSSPTYLTCMNDILYFRANHPTYGNYELWKFDGTTAELVYDAYPGNSYSDNPFSGSVTKLTVADDKLYFYARNDVNGTELYSYDGVETIMYDNTLGKSNPSDGSIIGFDNELYGAFKNTSSSYNLALFPNNDVVGEQTYSSMSNFTVLKPEPTLDFTENIVVNEDSEAFDIVFKGFSDPDNRDLNISFEHNASSLVDINTSWISGTKKYSEYNEKEIKFTVKPKTDLHGEFVIYVTLDNGLSKTTEAVFVTIKSIDDEPTFVINPINIEYVTGTTNSTQTISAEDIDLDTIVYTATSLDTSIVTVSVIGGKITFTPKTQTVGESTSIDINATANGVTIGQTITYTVIPPNNLPVITEGSSKSVIMTEDNASSFELTLHATDEDNETLAWSIDTNASKGTASVSGTGNSKSISYSPNTNYNGADSFIVKITDAKNGTDIITVNVTVNPVNDTPTIDTVFSDVIINEDNGTTSYDINVSDIEGDELNITVESNNTDILKVTPSWSGLLTQGYYDGKTLDFNLTTVQDANGIVQITIMTNDGDLNSTKTFDINVTAANDAPTSLDINTTINEDDNKSFVLNDFRFTDIDTGDTLNSIYISSLPTLGILSVNDVTVSLNQELSLTDLANLKYVPVKNGNGTAYTTFGFKVNDGEVNSTIEYTTTINIDAIDDAPVLDAISNVIKSEDTSDFNITLVANDIESDDINYTVTSSDTSIATVSILDGKVVVTPLSNENGTITVEVNATANGKSSVQSFTVLFTAVNDTPTIDTVFSNLVINEDNGTTSYDLNVSDIEGDELNVTVESNNTDILTVTPSWSGLLTQGYYDGRTLDFNLTTVENANGIAQITIMTNDGDLNSTQTFDVNVSAVNDAPILDALSNRIYFKNFSQKDINLTTSDIDNDSDDLNITVDILKDDIVKSITVDNNTMTIISQDGTYGNTDVNVTLSDGDLNVSKVFNIQVLSIKSTSDIEEEASPTVVTTDGNTTTSTNKINDDITIETSEDTNGTKSHEIVVGTTTVKASSDINGSVVETTASGVHTYYEDTTSKVKAEVNATVTGKASHSLTLSDGKITTASSEIIGARTTISKNTLNEVEIVTNVSLDTNVTATVTANEDGSATHTVELANGSKSTATSKVKGTTTIIKSDKSIETDVKTDDSKEATVITKEDGTNIVTLKTSDGVNIDILADGESFGVESNIIIEQIDGELQMTIQSPLTENLQF